MISKKVTSAVVLSHFICVSSGNVHLPQAKVWQNEAGWGNRVDW